MAVTHFTCPHCGVRCSTELDVEYVDLGNGLPDAVFPMLPPEVERHINMRLCCDKCYAEAGRLLPAGADHPYDVATHVKRMAAVDAAAKEK
jgi:hypothetical protein